MRNDEGRRVSLACVGERLCVSFIGNQISWVENEARTLNKDDEDFDPPGKGYSAAELISLS